MEDINRKLGRNECVLKFKLDMFPVLLSKLSDVWSVVDVVTDDNKRPQTILALSTYTVKDELGRMVFVFSDEEVADNTIKTFLKDNKEEPNKETFLSKLVNWMRRK